MEQDLNIPLKQQYIVYLNIKIIVMAADAPKVGNGTPFDSPADSPDGVNF